MAGVMSPKSPYRSLQQYYNIFIYIPNPSL